MVEIEGIALYFFYFKNKGGRLWVNKKTKKIIVFLLLTITILTITSNIVYAGEAKGGEKPKSKTKKAQEEESDQIEEQYKVRQEYQELIDREKGTLFEKAIANLVASFAYTLSNIGSTVLGFNDLDTLLFNKKANEDLPPFDEKYLNKLNNWYKSTSLIGGSLLIIAVVIVGIKFIRAGTNPKMREEAMAALKRLVFSSIMVALAPLFVHLLIRINNSLVSVLASISGAKSVTKQLGTGSEGVLNNIRTGNVIATACAILLFAFINFKLNIMFLIRLFILTTLYIFTPFVAVMWVISKDVNAAGIWLGEMLSNAFMQFAYAFVFSIYLSFTGENIHWATSLIWAMLVLSVADVIRNSVQSIYTKASGIDESRHAGAIMGLFGLAGISSMANTVGSQFSSAVGPGGSAISRAMNMAAKTGGFMAQGTSSASSMTASEGSHETTMGSFTGAGPNGGSIEKASVFASALDQSAGAGYYAERGISASSGIGAAAAGPSGAGFIKGMGKMTGTGVRAVGGAIGMGVATRQHMKENSMTLPETLKDLTGTDNTGKAILRTGNLYASHVFSSQARVRDKLVSYHTSIDGMRYK